MRMLCKLLIHQLLLTFSIAAFAQSQPGQWVGDLYSVEMADKEINYWVLVDEKNNIRNKIPSFIGTTAFPFPIEKVWLSGWHEGALYAIGTFSPEYLPETEDGSPYIPWAIAKWKDDEWHFVGEFKGCYFLQAIPCEEDRFIVVSDSSYRYDTTNNGRDVSPFARASIHPSKNEVRQSSRIDFGQNDLKKYMPDEDCYDLAVGSRTIITDRHAILVDYNTGLYWIFSRENASLKKTGNVFKKMEPEKIAEGGIWRAILCANPEKEGTVLLAAQDENLFAAAKTTIDDWDRLTIQFIEDRHALTGNIDYSKMTDEFRERLSKEEDEFLKRREKALAESSPYIVWYRIYPEGGRVEKLSGAPEGGTLFREGGKNDCFRPLPDGSVRMGSVETVPYEKGKADGDKADKTAPQGAACAKGLGR